MSPKTICLLAVLVACAYPAAANTYYVGGCKPGSFATISAAVNAAAAGSTIMICAGTYSEQVIISKDLTLKGLDSSAPGGGAGAVIANPGTLDTTTSPIFSFNNNPILGGTIAPIVWVTAGTVTIENVFVTSTTINYCPNITLAKTVGFYYATGASGTLNHVGFFTQSCGVGIWAENASFTPTAVTVENSYSAAGIVAGSLPNLVDGTLTVKITGNQVFPTAPDGAYGIYLYGVSGTVESNLLSGPRVNGGVLSGSAIWDDGTAQTDVTISGNTIQVVDDVFIAPIFYAGITVNVDGATVKGNKISGTSDGIDVTCHAGTVSGNTISYASNGLLGVPAASLGVNTFYNTVSKISGC